MATEQQNNGSTDETSGQEQQQDQHQAGTTDETSSQDQQQSTTVDDSTQLPDTHPLVKAYKAQVEVNRKNTATAAELAEARAQAGKATKLEEELGKRPTTEAMETLQTRYDRLEAFTQAVGLGKALDSRTFTKDLFESDKDIATLVKEWNRANPTATSQALGAGGAAPAGDTPSMNDILRAARK